MQRIVGIDPGLDGGLVVLVDGLISMGRIMPTIDVGDGKREIDPGELYDFLWWACVSTAEEMRAEVYLERQHSMPSQGVASTFRTGMGYGFIRGMLVGMGVPYKVVAAKQWQRAIFADILGPGRAPGDTKGMSIMAAQRIWPTVDFRANARCRVSHHGITDAACIAEYARRLSLVEAIERNDRKREAGARNGDHH